MSISRQEVRDNTVINADFTTLSIDTEFAMDIADVILKNHSIQSDFYMADLDDTRFLIIKNALVQRNRRLVELNLDVTDITANSMSALQDLMNKNLVLRLYLFKTKGIYDSPENMKILTDCAKGNKIYISFVSAGNRQSVETFFGKHTDEQKDPSPSHRKTPIENEFEQMHDPLNGSFKKT
jgi:hypothetical protein